MSERQKIWAKVARVSFVRRMSAGWLRDRLAEVCKVHGDDALLIIDYDDDRADGFDLELQREETDLEYARREAARERVDRERETHDRAELARLQEKYK